MKKVYVFFIIFISTLTLNAQVATTLVNLETPALNETSGIIYYNDKLITHNDSGSDAKLYEISTVTGFVTRTVTITNATNVDWEDIAQDDTHIYIGDIGNNSGNRTDLKIYKISKADYDGADNTAVAEIISYSYADQTSFTANVNNNNWDAEGFISYGGHLLVFTKNWADNMVNVYAILKSSGSHSAVLVSSYDTNGLITGADTSADEAVIYLSGYSTSEAPFLYTIHAIPENSLGVFSGTVSSKISAVMPIGNQLEGVALFEITPTKHRLYLTNEKYIVTLAGGLITIPFHAKLWFIEIDSVTLEVKNANFKSELIAFPNPFDTALHFNTTVDEVKVFDMLGKRITEHHNVNRLSLENLTSGIYFVHLKKDDTIIIQKVIRK